MAVTLKKERIDIRVTNDAKTILERAAEINNISLSSYIISVCLRQARIDLKENERLMLNSTEAKIIVDSLNNPKKPNDALKKLMKCK